MFAFELVDAQSGEVLKQLGNERLFRQDSIDVFSIRSGVAQYAGREIIIRARVLGIARARKDIAYTVVHVHGILTEETESTALAKMSDAGDGQSQLPITFALYQNYPNPFNPFTEIKFDLPEPGTVSLVVYDVLGRKVAELASGYREAGYHSAIWNASNQASGVHFARFNVTGGEGRSAYSKINKLVLLR